MTRAELFNQPKSAIPNNPAGPLRLPTPVGAEPPVPRSMTRAELFNQPKSAIPNNPAGPLRLPTPVGAEPTGRVAKGLAWAEDAMSAAAKSKYVAPVLGAIKSPLGQAVGKLGGVSAQFALHHGDAGAPTLDDERVAAMGRPYDPDWQPGNKPYTPRTDSVALWGNETRRNSPMAGVAAPTAPVRSAEDFTKALRSVPDKLPAGLRDGMVYKTKDAKGNVTYSGRNVTGDVSDRMLNGDGTSAGPMRGSLRVSAGAPTFGPNGSYVIDNQAPTGEAKQAQINASLRNPDGSQWSARDNAIMAANLRDGVDPMRGTSRQPAQNDEEKIPAIGEFGHNRAVAAKAERDRLKATLRGQDMQHKIAMAPIEMQARMRQIASQISQHTKGDHAASARLAMEYGSPEMAAQFQTLHTAELANKGSIQAQSIANEASARDSVAKNFTRVNKDGVQEIDPVSGAAAYDNALRGNPDYARMTPDQRVAVSPEITSLQRATDAARATQNTGFVQGTLGLLRDSPVAPLDAQTLKNGKFAERGLLSSALYSKGKHIGDRILLDQHGNEIRNFGSGLNDEDLATLKRRQKALRDEKQ